MFNGELVLMSYILDRSITKADVKPLVVMKYVNNILAKVKKDKLLGELNRAHYRIRFTCEKKENERINFLSLISTRRKGQLLTKQYKDVLMDIILNYVSNHPFRIKYDTI